MANLVTRINLLASALAAKFNAIKPRLLPSGGTTGQVLTKNSNGDYDVGLTTPGTAFLANTGTTGHTLPFLDGTNIWSNAQTFASTISASNISGTNTGDQTTISGNAGSATKLATARTLSLVGDASGSVTFDGTANAAITTTLTSVFGGAGTYGSASAVPVMTVDGKGRVTALTTAALGSAATAATGSSGHVVPFLDSANTWAAGQAFGGTTNFNAAVNINYQTLTASGSAIFSGGVTISNGLTTSGGLVSNTYLTSNGIFTANKGLIVPQNTNFSADLGDGGTGSNYALRLRANNSTGTAVVQITPWDASAQWGAWTFGNGSATWSGALTTGALATFNSGIQVNGYTNLNGNIGFANGTTMQVGSGVAAGFYGDGTNLAMRALNVSGSMFYFQSYNGASNWMTLSSSAMNVSVPATFNGAALFQSSVTVNNGNLTVNGNAYTYDILASRSATQGVIYLGSNGGAYLYNDGSTFQLTGRPLNVSNGGISAQGTIQIPSGNGRFQVGDGGGTGNGFWLYNYNGTTDSKYWRMYATGTSGNSVLNFDCMNDASNAASTWMYVTRSGQTPNGVTIIPSLNLSSVLTLNATGMIFNGGSGGATVGYGVSTGVFLDGANVGFRTYGNNGIYFQNGGGSTTYAFVASNAFTFNVPINHCVNQWFNSTDGVQRLYFGNGDATYVNGNNRIIFRTNQADRFYVNGDGSISVEGSIIYVDGNATSGSPGHYIQNNNDRFRVNCHFDVNGNYIFASYFNQSSGANENPSINQVIVDNGDGYHRKAGLSYFINSAFSQNINSAILSYGGVALNRQPLYVCGNGDTNHAYMSGSGRFSYYGSDDGEYINSWAWFMIRSAQTGHIPFFIDGRNGQGRDSYTGMYDCTDPRRPLEVNGVIQSCSMNGGSGNFECVGGNRKVMMRNDGGRFYLLFSDDQGSADAARNSSFNGMRPYSFDFAGTNRFNEDNNSDSYFIRNVYGNNFRVTSDRRLKKSFRPIADPLAMIERMQGWFFDKKSTLESNEYLPSLGFIADEVEAVIPEIVTTGIDGLQSVEYSNVVPVLVEAIKALRSEVLALKGAAR